MCAVPSVLKMPRQMLIAAAAEATALEQTATMGDISRIIKSIEIRDQRIQAAETELRKITEEYRRLRDELLPIFRMAKDRSQPLPYHPNSHSPDHPEENGVSPMTAQLPPDMKSTILSRKFSTKRLFLGSTPKSSSPTHIPPSVSEGKSMADTSTLDPSAAAIAASNHLTAGMNGGSQPSASPNQANMPSPTSPNTYSNHLQGRSYREQPSQGTVRTIYSHAEDPSGYSSTSTFVSERDRGNPTPTPTPGTTFSNAQSQRRPPRENYQQMQQQQPPLQAQQPDESQNSGGSSGVEIFKSFRVSMEDPCEKVLPAALKKYNIIADWRNYALYIVFGDQERCLGLKEKPLILFKQLDREGKKPMFMLRKHAAPMEGHSGPTNGAGGGYDTGLGGPGSGRGNTSSIQLPGGVL